VSEQVNRNCIPSETRRHVFQPPTPTLFPQTPHLLDVWSSRHAGYSRQRSVAKRYDIVLVQQRYTCTYLQRYLTN